MAHIYDNMHICGNILSSKSYSFFALQCIICDSAFGQWTSFLRHLEKMHGPLKVEPDEEYDDSMNQGDGEELKEESFLNDTVDVKETFVFPEEEHSIFFEEQDELELGNSEEIINDIMQERSVNIPIPEDLIEAKTEKEESESDEDKPLSRLRSKTKELHTKAIKKFRFDLCSEENLAMSLDFLRIFRSYRVLWDPNHGKYRKPRKLSAAQAKIKLFFKKKRIDISDQVLQATISNILRKYKMAHQEKKESAEVCPQTELLLEKCSFLDGVVKIDFDTADEDDNESALKNDSENELPDSSAKYQNRIIFSDTHPIVEDFIERYKDNAILWDTTMINYNNRVDRKKILENWIDAFKSEYNIPFTYDELSYSMQEFRRIYYKNVQRRDANVELDDYAKLILNKGSFLPPRSTLKQIKCEHCDKVFHQEHTYKRHVYVDHSIGEMPFKCSFCEVRFEDHIVHRRHELRYHYKDYKYICEDYCKKAFFTRDELERHLLKHTGEKKFVCELCGRGFAKKTNLRNHDTRVHLRQRNFPCNMCPKAFYTKRLLQDHINAHLNIRDKVCPTCGKGFTSHHSLIRHKQIHSEVKRYACKLCDARFHQFVGLNSHMKNTHKYVRGKNETQSDEDEKATPLNG